MISKAEADYTVNLYPVSERKNAKILDRYGILDLFYRFIFNKTKKNKHATFFMLSIYLIILIAGSLLVKAKTQRCTCKSCVFESMKK